MRIQFIGAVRLIWSLACGVARAQDEKPAKKLQTPDRASLARAERTIKDLFKSEYAKKSASEMLQLANTLVGQAQETKNDPAARFVLYREASLIAAKAGEFLGALAVLDELGREFVTEIGPLKIATLKLGAEKGASGGSFNNRYLAEAALFVFPDAIASSDPQIANDLIALAESAAKKAGIDELTERVKARRADLGDVLRQYAEYLSGQSTLASKSDDPNANLQVGRYLCFIKGEWERGLPLLEQCGDEKLKFAAARDLGKPTDSGALVRLADDWLDLSDKQIRAARRQISGRAATWYREAIPRLSGITQTKARERTVAIYKEFPGLRDGSSDLASIFWEYKGLWEVRYTNQIVRYYIFDARGNGYFLWPGGARRSRLIPDGKIMLLSFGQPVKFGVDHITLKDGELSTDFYGPATHFQCTGIGKRILPQDTDLAKLDEPSSADPKADADLLPLVGTWFITYTDQSMRFYQIYRNGDVLGALEPARAGTAKLKKIEDTNGAPASGAARYLIDFKDNTMERVWVSGGKLRVDHFYPASKYPAGPIEPLGIGVRLSD